MRGTFVAAIAITALTVCHEAEQAPPIGAVRIHTSIASATLFVDATERGPLEDGMEIELAPGSHVFEARRDGAIVGRAVFEARSALIFDVQLVETAAPGVAEGPAPPPSVPTPEPPNSAGSLSADQIRAVVTANRSSVLECYGEHATPQTATVRIDVDASIAPDGAVTRASAEGGGDATLAMRQCIEERVRAWRFPPSGGTTSVSFPFVFTGSGDTPPPAAGPSTPSRGDIVSAMNAVSREVAACGNGQHGIANARMVFDSSGRVSNATVAGGSFPAPVASCIARAARQARVPPFTQPTFSVNYPFRL